MPYFVLALRSIQLLLQNAESFLRSAYRKQISKIRESFNGMRVKEARYTAI
jgi:hypothetical protein